MIKVQNVSNHTNVRPKVSIEESVHNMVAQIRRYGYDDFDNPRYYNICWVRLLEEVAKIIAITGSVFEAPPRPKGKEASK